MKELKNIPPDDFARIGGAMLLAFFSILGIEALSALEPSAQIVIGIGYAYFTFLLARKRG